MEKKNSFMKGVMILLVSQIIIKFLGFIYRVIITNMQGFGDKGNSFYGSAFRVYMVLLALSTTGIPAALAKLVSEKVAVGDRKGAHKIFRIALYLFSAIGAVGTLILVIFADPIANGLANPGVQFSLYTLAPSIFFVAIAAVYRGYFQGLSDMRAQADSQVIDQLAKCVFTVAFAYILVGQIPEITAAGATLGTTVGTVASVLYLLWFYNKRRDVIWKEIKNAPILKQERPRQIIQNIIKLSIPISLGSIVLTIAGLVDLVTVMNRLIASGVSYNEANKLFGILVGKSDVLINLPLALNIAFATSLVPAVAGALATKDYNTAARRISFSLFTTIIIILPAAIGLAVLCDPILKLIFPRASEGAFIIQVSAYSTIFIAICQTMSGSLQGMGLVFVPAVSLAIGGIIKLVLNYILIGNVSIGIIGAAYSSIACYFVASLISFIRLRKNIKLPDVTFSKYVIKPVIATGLMAVALTYSYKLVFLIVPSRLIGITVSALIGGIVYVLGLVALKTFSNEDIKMLPFGTKIAGFFGKSIT